MAREDREVRERLAAEAADEAYMADLRRQHPELVEAERAIFTERAVDGEFIVISDDEVQCGDDGSQDEEFDAWEWRRIFPDRDDDGTGPDPMGGGMSRQDSTSTMARMMSSLV